MKISVIIPAYNEAAVIEENMRLLEHELQAKAAEYEIVIVSDGSRDDTRRIVRERLASAHIVDAGYENNLGKGGALKAGVAAASGDIIVTTDCDLAYGCDVIFEAAELMERDAACEVLIGSRSLAKDGFAGYPMLRKLASKIYFKLISLYAGLSVSDSQCGFKCYRRSAAKVLFDELVTCGFAFDLEILLRAGKHGFKIAELPVSIKNHGQSKVNVLRDSIRMLRDITKIKRLCAGKTEK